jgi:hypothetical protein
MVTLDLSQWFRYNGRPPLAGALQVAFFTQDDYARESVSGISLVGTITCIKKRNFQGLTPFRLT